MVYRQVHKLQHSNEQKVVSTCVVLRAVGCVAKIDGLVQA